MRMRTWKTFPVLLFAVAALLLTACQKQQGSEAPAETSVQSTQAPTETQAETSGKSTAQKEKIPSFKAVPVDADPVEYIAYSRRIEAEETEYKGTFSVEQLLSGYSGEGYLTGFENAEKDKITAVFDIPAAQHYDLSIQVCASTPVSNILLLNGKEVGTFTITEPNVFTRVTFPGIYIPEGEAKLSIQEIDGYFSLDYFEVNHCQDLQNLQYAASYPLSDPEASAGAQELMAYLSRNYGGKVLSGQYASDAADTELEALHRLTGKYPAIRFGDLEGYTENSAADYGDVIVASQNWAKKGGIVGLMWHWDAPAGISSVYADETDFSLKQALPSAAEPDSSEPAETTETTEELPPEEEEAETEATETPEELQAETAPALEIAIDVALMETREINQLVKQGKLSESCAALLRDIDSVSEALKPLAKQDVPVLWRPLHEAGGDWFWWSSDGAEAYQWLWDVLYRRMTEYHGLHNLIWVWNGQDSAYLPGQYDIASLDAYLSPEKDFGSRYEQFVTLYRMTGGSHILALSECSTVPDVNQMFRDRTIWSFAGLWYGEYLLNSDGSYSGTYTPAKTMIDFYNSEAVLTLDDTKKGFTFTIEETVSPEE